MPEEAAAIANEGPTQLQAVMEEGLVYLIDAAHQHLRLRPDGSDIDREAEAEYRRLSAHHARLVEAAQWFDIATNLRAALCADGMPAELVQIFGGSYNADIAALIGPEDISADQPV